MNRKAWIIVIVVIVVIILFVVYKYINRKPKANVTVVTNRNSATTRQSEIVSETINEASDSEVISESETENITDVVEEKVEKNVISNDFVDCNSLGYRQQVSLLAINLQQLQSKLDIANINFNNKKDEKNKQALELVSSKLQKAKEDYLTMYNKCNKK